MSLAEVSSVLWRLRELLELLHFKLEEEQLLLANGKGRWLARATHEVELVLSEIRQAELRRAAEVEGLAAELGLGSSPSLAVLSESVPAPWREIFREHRKAFLETTAEITAIAQSNRDLLTAGYQAAQETLAALTGSAHDPALSSYTPTGAKAAAPLRQRLFDEAI
jgi:hypothetical protein